VICSSADVTRSRLGNLHALSRHMATTSAVKAPTCKINKTLTGRSGGARTHVIEASASSKYRIVLYDTLGSLLRDGASADSDTGTHFGALECMSEHPALKHFETKLLLLMLLLLLLLKLSESEESIILFELETKADVPMNRSEVLSTLLLPADAAPFSGGWGGEFDESSMVHSICRLSVKETPQRKYT
jgi:hypothetical protein